MKVKAELVEERRNGIMKYIQENGEASVKVLCSIFKVSELTIRRDLQYWEDRYAVERYYGGAKLIQDFVSNSAESLKERSKLAIAKFAAQHVEDGDIIFINSSSTAFKIVEFIKDKYVTVITNNGKAIHSQCDPRITIIMTGGEIRFPKQSLVGEFALSNLNQVRANKLFLGCSGFDLEHGASTAIMDEVQINKKMIERCNGETFLLADSSKFKKLYNFKITDLSSFDYLITDTGLDEVSSSELSDTTLNTIVLQPL